MPSKRGWTILDGCLEWIAFFLCLVLCLCRVMLRGEGDNMVFDARCGGRRFLRFGVLVLLVWQVYKLRHCLK